jgi:hypothetical protein
MKDSNFDEIAYYKIFGTFLLSFCFYGRYNFDEIAYCKIFGTF